MIREPVGRASLGLVAATLLVLPFESVLPDDHAIAGYTFTTLELVGLVALGAWLTSLAADRRLPTVPMSVAVALGGFLAVGLASAVIATDLAGEALDAAFHAVAGGLLFLAVADVATRHQAQKWLTAAIVVGATASALYGLGAYALAFGTPIGMDDFTTTGVRRLAGTLDYPNTAAMYYEAALLLAIGLVLAAPRRVVAVAVGAAALILLGATLLTLSRGAVLGLCTGLAVIAVVALVGATADRRRAWLAAGIGALLVALVALPLSLARSDGPVTNPPRDRINAEYAAPAGASVSGGRAVVPVTVTNTGSEPWNVGGDERFRLGFHWLTPDARRLLGDGFEQSPIGPLQPGESRIVNATLTAEPPALGHVVAWDVFMPGQAWLSQYGVPVATTQIVSMGRPGEQPLPPPTIPRQLNLYEDLVTTPTRAELWSAALAMTVERPLLGHGPGTFQLRYGPYLGLDDWDTDIHANNTYLELSSTVGVLGLAAFVVLVALVLVPLIGRVVRPARTVTRADALFGAALAGALVAFLVHGTVDYFIGFNPTGGLFWAILGLALVSGRARS